jgi:hypothetical protein
MALGQCLRDAVNERVVVQKRIGYAGAWGLTTAVE